MHQLKSLNKDTKRIFLAIINAIPAGETATKWCRAGPGSPILDLCVEKLSDPVKLKGQQLTVYSFAHYYQQNGDAMRDPEINFAVQDLRTEAYPVIEQVNVWPIYFRQDDRFIEQELIMCDQEHNVQAVATKEQLACTSFANTWLFNLKSQQNITPADVPDVLVWMNHKSKQYKLKI